MGPRGFTLPSAKTDSAKAARSAFYCELCQKGYSRMNEFEAHESSYDHQHKKRLKDMKEMQKQVQNAGRKEEKGPLMTIKLGVPSAKTGTSTSSASGGFKKGGFKNAFGPIDDISDMTKKEEQETGDIFSTQTSAPEEKKAVSEQDSDVTDDDDDYYNPGRPTGCLPECGRSPSS